jgi:hypothetical protein
MIPNGRVVTARGTRRAAARPARNRGLRLVSLRVLAPAAAVVLAAAGYGLSQLAGGARPWPAAPPRAAGAAKAASRANAPAVAAKQRRAAAGHCGPSAWAPASFPFVTSHTNFMPGTLKQQVEAALRAAESAPATQAVPAAVMACVRNVAGKRQPADGRECPLPGPGRHHHRDAHEQGRHGPGAGAGCSASHGKPLATTTVP